MIFTIQIHLFIAVHRRVVNYEGWWVSLQRFPTGLDNLLGILIDITWNVLTSAQTIDNKISNDKKIA